MRDTFLFFGRDPQAGGGGGAADPARLVVNSAGPSAGFFTTRPGGQSHLVD